MDEDAILSGKSHVGACRTESSKSLVMIKEKFMRHTHPLTVAKAMSDTSEKQDVAGAIFLQIWLTMLGLILSKGFS